MVLDKTDRYGVLTRREGAAADDCDHTFVRSSMLRTLNLIDHVVRQLPKYKIDQCSRTFGVRRLRRRVVRRLRHRVVPD
jgi:hypothetical protein